MQQILQDMVAANVFAFLLIFMRVGSALMIMPGVGDTFVSQHSRLLFALAFSFVITPVLAPFLPRLPENAFALGLLVLHEALVGVFLGTVMRIMVSALDTAGAVVSAQAGLSSATVFNPANATQGSMTGALYSMLGVTLIFATDLHHYMFASIFDSYRALPSGGAIDIADMSQTIRDTVSGAFRVGVQMAIPFLIVGTLIQVGFGLLGRLLPQIQIFFVALPAQIWISLILFSLTLSVAMLYWLDTFGAALVRPQGL